MLTPAKKNKLLQEIKAYKKNISIGILLSWMNQARA
jgi:hypothetical protein